MKSEDRGIRQELAKLGVEVTRSAAGLVDDYDTRYRLGYVVLSRAMAGG